jgi:hypothetical protein
MNKSLFSIALVIVFLAQVGCRTTHVHKAPPGQVKKVAGTKSAKPFAPGQLKKATGSQSAKPFAPGQQGKGKGKKKKNQ